MLQGGPRLPSVLDRISTLTILLPEQSHLDSAVGQLLTFPRCGGAAAVSAVPCLELSAWHEELQPQVIIRAYEATTQQLLQLVLAKAAQAQHAPPLSSLNRRPTARARAQGTRDPVLRSLSITMKEFSRGNKVDVRELLQGLQQHAQAMQVMGSLTELKLVGVSHTNQKQ